jgi:methylated-DNA-[protein]-cysteine S-methyltransferase
MSAQAVGGAVGHNPISILIPCHRVVDFNGSLTGYAGGLDKKAALLRIEKVNLAVRLDKIGCDAHALGCPQKASQAG